MTNDVLMRRGGALEPTAPGMNRRQLLKAGAWAAPALVLATAAPAAAASTSPNTSQPTTPTSTNVVNVYTFSQNGVQQVWSPSANANVVQGFLGQTNFSPNWNSTAVTSATLTLIVPARALVVTAPVVLEGSGWVAGSGTRSGDNMIYTFVWAGNVGPNASSPTLKYKLVADGTTPTSAATPKTVSGTLSGSQVKPVTVATSW